MPHLQQQANNRYSIRWRETRQSPEGQLVEIHASKPLGKFASRRAALVAFREEAPKIASLPADPKSSMLVGDFIGSCFLPAAKTRLRASTSYGYSRLFEEHKEFLPDIPLRDFRCVDGETMLVRIQTVKGLSRNSLHNLRSWLSGAFSYAVRIGVLDRNPIREVSIPRAPEAEDTGVYTLEEIADMLRKVPGRAAAVIAVAAYTGLRRGELAALQWSDYDGQTIQVQRAKWRNTIDSPKTRKSAAPVPVIAPLRDILEDWRVSLAVQGKQAVGWMFDDKPLEIAWMEEKEVKPFVAEWRGWHPFRRGLATSLKRLGVEDVVIQSVLRHSHVSTTQSCYIKTGRADVLASMDKLAVKVGEI